MGPHVSSVCAGVVGHTRLERVRFIIGTLPNVSDGKDHRLVAGVADGNIEEKVCQLYEGTRTSNHFDTGIDAERGGFESHAISCPFFLSG